MVDIMSLTVEPKDYTKMVARKLSTDKYNVKGVVFNKGSKNVYNVEIQMDTETLEKTSKVRVSCSCDDFKFRWAAVLHTKGGLLNPNKFRLDPPKVTNPNNVVQACKHIHTFIKNEMDHKLRTISTRRDSL